MNLSGASQFNQARIEWAIRLRFSPMPNITMDWISSNLNAFRIGEMRVVGKIWETMMERDGELAVNADKRASDLAALDWQIVSDGSPEGDRHAEALRYFYQHLRTTRALDQDVCGGVSELLYQMASAHSYYYSVHEMLLRIDNPAARQITAEFRHTPIWFFESRRGYLGYLKHIFDVYGQPCLQGEWLTVVGSGWMRALSVAYVMKALSLRDWMLFSQRYGTGVLEAITAAQKGDPAWEEARKVLEELTNDGAAIHNESVNVKFLTMPASSTLPFAPLVDLVNRLYAKCYRGIDLATGSRASEAGGGRNVLGASLQKEESGIFLARDAAWATECLNERVDRPVIRYLFDKEPRAWMAVLPPLDENADEDLKSLQTLVPMGLRISLKEAYKRFRWTAPAAGEPCLQSALQPHPQGREEDGAQSTLPASSPAQDGPPTPIAAGADPRRNPQTANLEMPDPQVDDAGFYSQAALMPALAYAVPNEPR
jgi:phage gp29-like protein